MKNVANKTGEASKNAFETVKTKSQELIETNKTKMHEAKIKKYNPLFPEKFKAYGNNLPNIIMIKDDAERRDVDVCKGAIGWTKDKKDGKGMEMMYLYDNVIEYSELYFKPTPSCNSVYHVHPLNRNVYINVDNYHEVILQEKLAELEHIAYSLGAVEYKVRVVSNKFSEATIKQNSQMAVKNNTAGEAYEGMTSNVSYISAKAGAVWAEKRPAVRPVLRWFASDNSVLNLVDMRCSNEKSDMIEYDKTLDTAGFASMSLNMAASVDATIVGAKAKMSSNFCNNSKEEHSQKIQLYIKF